MLAGFPCTDLSRARRQKGFYGINSLEHYLYLKENNHKFQEQSYLFWEFVRLFNEYLNNRDKRESLNTEQSGKLQQFGDR